MWFIDKILTAGFRDPNPGMHDNIQLLELKAVFSRRKQIRTLNIETVLESKSSDRL